MSESHVLLEIEAACAHHKICVLPRNPKRLSCSVWAMPDPAYHHGVIWRVNTGVARYRNQFVRFGMPGDADFSGWIFSSSKRIELEAKCGKAKLSPDQVVRGALCLRTGLLYGVVRSYADCDELLTAWGV